MSSYLNANKTYLTLTPAGIFEAFSQSEPTPEQLSLQDLLSHNETLDNSIAACADGADTSSSRDGD